MSNFSYVTDEKQKKITPIKFNLAKGREEKNSSNTKPAITPSEKNRYITKYVYICLYKTHCPVPSVMKKKTEETI